MLWIIWAVIGIWIGGLTWLVIALVTAPAGQEITGIGFGEDDNGKRIEQ